MELKLRGLNIGYKKWFKEKIIVRNVNLDIKDNGIYGIIGRSGSGKTTLVSSMIGILPPMNGNVYYDDVDIYDESYIKRGSYFQDKITFLPAYQTLYKNLTIKENVLMYKLDPKEFSKLIKNFIPENIMSKKPSQLSKGQGKMCEILIAIMIGNEYLFIDEPTSDLDIVNTELVFKLLQGYKDTRKIFIISHDKEAISQYADALYLVENHYVTVLKEYGEEKEEAVKEVKDSGTKYTRNKDVPLNLLTKSITTNKYFLINDCIEGILLSGAICSIYCYMLYLAGTFYKMPGFHPDKDPFKSMLYQVDGFYKYYGVIAATLGGLCLLLMIYTGISKVNKKKRIPAIYKLSGLNKKEKLFVSLVASTPLIVITGVFLAVLNPVVVEVLLPKVNKDFHEAYNMYLNYNIAALTTTLLYLGFSVVYYLYTYYMLFLKKYSNSFKEDN